MAREAIRRYTGLAPIRADERGSYRPVPLFAEEMVRVLAPDGAVVWSNALGMDAPHHVPINTVLFALERASGGAPWSAVTSEAGWGLWATLRRRS